MGKVNKGQTQRYIMIDSLRGIAVLLMIIFHFGFDLNGFRFVRIDFSANPFWSNICWLICIFGSTIRNLPSFLSMSFISHKNLYGSGVL